MIKLNSGNVLLKPSHRKQLMSWLKRTLKLGSRLDHFVLSITMHRTGRFVEIKADVSDRREQVVFRARQHDWQDAARQLVRELTTHLHNLMVRGAAA